MHIFVIYHGTSEWGDLYVARAWRVTEHGAFPGAAGTSKTLEGARALVPDGYVRTERHENDDPTIVEVWI